MTQDAGSLLKRLIRREVDGNRELIVGRVLSDPRLTDFDSLGGGRWVVDVEIGGANYLRNVPVKALGENRFYAQLGQTVSLRRNAQGRFEVVGPGDRLSQPLRTIEYDLATGVGGAPVTSGFVFERVAFSYYATADLTAPLDVLWADGVTAFNLVRVIPA